MSSSPQSRHPTPVRRRAVGPTHSVRKSGRTVGRKGGAVPSSGRRRPGRAKCVPTSGRVHRLRTDCVPISGRLSAREVQSVPISGRGYVAPDKLVPISGRLDRRLSCAFWALPRFKRRSSGCGRPERKDWRRSRRFDTVAAVGDGFGFHILGRMFAAEPYVLSVTGVERANALYTFDVRVALPVEDDLLADDAVLEQRVMLQFPPFSLGGGVGNRVRSMESCSRSLRRRARTRAGGSCGSGSGRASPC